MHDSFEIIEARVLQDVSGAATRLRHAATGAEVLAVCNADPELVFGIFFETHPTTSNGTAHLLEHLIFRGSQRYPATHLYSALVQGTMLTGLNASTRADNTLFHLSSGGATDFSGLIDVMLDAVFHPLLRHEDILEEREVVINEMIGHQAGTEQRLLERLRQALWPDSVYALDYGGAPALLAKLAPEEVRRFHATQYRPGNARLFLWGDIDLPRQLDQIDGHLASDSHQAVSLSDVSPMQRQVEPRDIAFKTQHQDEQFAGLGWAFDLQNADLWRALSFVLVAERGGLLRQTLSGLQTRLFGPGFTADTPTGTFEIALASPSAELRSKAIAEIRGALERLGENGIPYASTTRAIDQVELFLRGFGRPGPGPQGLRALNLIRERWRHGADPLAELDITARLTRLRKTLTDNPDALRDHVTRDLLGNPHVCVVTSTPQDMLPPPPSRPADKTPMPDPTVRGDRIALPPIARVNRPERVSKSTHALDAGVISLPVRGPELCRVELAVSLGGLGLACVALVPVFVSLLKRAEAADGIEISTQVRVTSALGGAGGIWLWLSGRSLPALGEKLLRQMQEILRLAAVDGRPSRERITADIAGLSSQIALSGHVFGEIRLRARGSRAGAWNEHLNGISQTTSLRGVLAGDPEEISANLRHLGQHLLEEAPYHLAISGFDPSIARQVLPKRASSRETFPDVCLPDLAWQEGVSTAASNFTVGQALNVRAPGAAQVVARLLETGWLWQSVRVAGGAYSTRCRYDLSDGILTLLSIRDPDPEVSLRCFARCPLWLMHNAEGDLLERCVAATAAQLAAAPRPDDAVAIALQRHLCGKTDKCRQADLDAVCAVDAASVREATEEMAQELARARTVILGTEAALRSFVETRPEAFDPHDA